LCARCEGAILRIDQAHACLRCGAPLVAGRCPECGERDFAFSAARCAALLAPPISRAVVVLKDSGERRYAAVLAVLLAEAAAGWLRADDVLVPVPASPQALRRRGFDHAADIAQELGRRTGLPVTRALGATPTADQRSLGRAGRFANRSGAFRVFPGVAPPRRVVLVDDVFTTGATLDAAARVLRAAGAAEVRALAVARSCRAGPRALELP
ncbi:MAG TPA: ComF family protein, partial [Coriobacteriia bacterium]|nr:ComF family protein [Coriobacteriia bacterium]